MAENLNGQEGENHTGNDVQQQFEIESSAENKPEPQLQTAVSTAETGSPSHLAQSTPTNRERTDVCRDFLKNICNRGSRCKYYHPIDQQQTQYQEDVKFCIDYQNRGCTRENCRYVHAHREDADRYKRNGEVGLSLARAIAAVTNKDNVNGIPFCKEFQLICVQVSNGMEMQSTSTSKESPSPFRLPKLHAHRYEGRRYFAPLIAEDSPIVSEGKQCAQQLERNVCLQIDHANGSIERRCDKIVDENLLQKSRELLHRFNESPDQQAVQLDLLTKLNTAGNSLRMKTETESKEWQTNQRKQIIRFDEDVDTLTPTKRKLPRSIRFKSILKSNGENR